MLLYPNERRVELILKLWFTSTSQPSFRPSWWSRQEAVSADLQLNTSDTTIPRFHPHHFRFNNLEDTSLDQPEVTLSTGSDKQRDGQNTRLV